MEYSNSVSVSGYLLSSLLYEHNSSNSDQEGFLIGDVIVRQTETISDNQISLKKEETVVNIYSHVPCEDVYSFYNFHCDIQKEKLDFYLKTKIQDVVGWYRFRRHTPLVMSLREKTVHKKLMAALPHGKRFVFGLFSSFVSDNSATHTFDHMFYLYNNARDGSFDPVTLNVVNLEDTTHDEYRLFPRAPVNTRSGTYCEITTSARGVDKVLESVLVAEDINTVLLDKIEALVEQVSSSEAEIGFLALDIKELEEKISKFVPKEVKNSSEEMESQVPMDEAGTDNNLTHVTEKEVCDVPEKQDDNECPPSVTKRDGSLSDDNGCARTRCFSSNKSFHKRDSESKGKNC